jgi:DNA-binding GntR family transcriptional regulator
MKLPKLDHASLAKQVVRVLRHQILSGELKPNDRVCESEIAQSLGISRAPVREALVELEREGLTVTYPRRGAYVKSFTEKDIIEIYTLRALLEGHAATLASSALKKADVRELQNLIHEMNSGIDIADTSEMNVEFHEKIFKLADHQRLHSSWRNLFAQTRMLSAMAAGFRIKVSDIMAEHEVLVDALVSGEKEHIRESFEKHILDSMKRLVGHLRQTREKVSNQKASEKKRRKRPNNISKNTALDKKEQSDGLRTAMSENTVHFRVKNKK